MADKMFGLAPRTFDETIPKLENGPAALVAPPPVVDYAAHVPAFLGMMQNDAYNDCVIAAYYHARQIW